MTITASQDVPGSSGRELVLFGPLVADRRDIHRHAEPGWCEVYTASKVASRLMALGWQVRLGAEVIAADARLGLPPQADFEFFYERALALGADPVIAARVRNGFTGVVASIRGVRPGPVVVFRFDLDANRGAEAPDEDHPPVRDGFASLHPEVHHNCGHDGHTAMGLELARLMLARRDDLCGELRLIFQPAEEGLRGARAMVAAGVVDDADYFVGCHLGIQALAVGEIISGYRDILGSVKLDVTFSGKGAHAAISPQEGRNALLAACVAAQNLMAIPRHGQGDTRINVGTLSGGESRNTVPGTASLAFELRSDEAEALEFLKEAATRVVEGAAAMHGVVCAFKTAGEASSASSSPALAALVHELAATMETVDRIRDDIAFKGSDDASEMMRRVTSGGGQSVYFGIGSPLGAVHHNPRFDFDEAALPLGVELLHRLACRLMTAPHLP
jgi:aminobenzoyl-glutamate utilization protein A